MEYNLVPYNNDVLDLFQPKVVPIDDFRMSNNFLSNFHEHEMEIDGKKWATVEHFFQAAKTLNEDDSETIRLAPGPMEAKKLGRIVHLRQDLDWEDIKINIMYKALHYKFQDFRYLKALLKTGMAELIEGNRHHDNEWGSCKCKRCSRKPGQNLLGILLMKVRSEIRINRKRTNEET